MFFFFVGTAFIPISNMCQSWDFTMQTIKMSWFVICTVWIESGTCFKLHGSINISQHVNLKWPSPLYHEICWKNFHSQSEILPHFRLVPWTLLHFFFECRLSSDYVLDFSLTLSSTKRNELPFTVNTFWLVLFQFYGIFTCFDSIMKRRESDEYTRIWRSVYISSCLSLCYWFYIHIF